METDRYHFCTLPLPCSRWWWATFFFFYQVGTIITLPSALLLPAISSSCSPSASFRALECPRREPFYVSGALIYAVATQETLLDCLALEAMVACVPGSHGTVTFGETVLGRQPPLEHHTDRRLKNTPSLSRKKAYLLIQEFCCIGQVSGLTQTSGLWKSSQRTESGR